AGVTGSLVEQAIENVATRAAGLMARAFPTPIPETILAALIAAETSFLFQSYRRLVAEGGALRILRRGAELLESRGALGFYARHVWGVVKGLVSPITGLVELAVLAVRFQIAANEWLMSQIARLPELFAEAQALRDGFEQFGETARSTLQSLRQRERLLEFAG